MTDAPHPMTSEPARLVIAGSTGLVGQALAQQARPDDDLDVVLLARRSVAAPHRGQRVVPTDFDQPDVPPTSHPASLAVCALGTTIKTAGSQQAFRKVDLDYVIAFASAAKAAGYKRFAVVSAVGADAHSRNFYLRTKGEMEDGLRAMDFAQLTILHPSLLLGHRQEFRLAERLSQWLAPLFTPLMVGSLSRYRPISADAVAGALMAAFHNPHQGVKVVPSDQLDRRKMR